MTESINRSLLIAGASGHAKVLAALGEALGWQVVGFADSQKTGHFGKPVRPWSEWDAKLPVAIGVGNPVQRERMFRELTAAGRELPTMIHPRAWVEPSAVLGIGTVVLAGAIVGVDATIGVGAILNTGSSVDHDCRLGDFVHVAPGAHLAGLVTVGIGTWIGIGAAVKQEIAIGSWSMIGAGAAVVDDVPDAAVLAGTPARVLRMGRYFPAE